MRMLRKPGRRARRSTSSCGQFLPGRQVSHGLGVILETQPAARTEFPGDVDDELGRGQKGEEDAVVKARVAPKRFGTLDLRFQHAQVVEVFAHLGQPFYQPGHEESVLSFFCRIRRRNGSRSAARSWTSLKKGITALSNPSVIPTPQRDKSKNTLASWKAFLCRRVYQACPYNRQSYGRDYLGDDSLADRWFQMKLVLSRPLKSERNHRRHRMMRYVRLFYESFLHPKWILASQIIRRSSLSASVSNLSSEARRRWTTLSRNSSTLASPNTLKYARPTACWKQARV